LTVVVMASSITWTKSLESETPGPRSCFARTKEGGREREREREEREEVA